ncbi:MAG: 3,4-dihydroxy-2-butanone-4-phosphate synthase [Candidatus Thermoplasmatota archaeon]|nr:3,4-dihydroxy-2-butanone-4-phosphate synthase [Candidatus Thermoplasmatota archaeon]
MDDLEIGAALDAYREGRFVIVYDADGREEECDLFLPAESCAPEHIRTMRKDGGGLIFLMVRPDIRDRLGLPFLQEMFPRMSRDHPVLKALISDDIPYDNRSSFSLSINHRRTFTGITDNDRALTVRSFGELAGKALEMSEAEALSDFGEYFRSPGHVPICIGSDHILENRFGHTELSCALSTMAGLSGVSVGCEMMGDDGNAMPKDRVKEYARERGIPFLEGRQIIQAWKGWDGEWKNTYVPEVHGDRKAAFSEEAAVDRSVTLPKKRGKRVMASGVFDLMHPGHLSFLEQAKALGDQLVVVVARDSTVRSLKRHPIMNERSRREMVASIKWVDAAVLGYETGRYRIVREIEPDIIALGYDQQQDEDTLRRELAREGIDVELVRLDKRAGDIEATSELLHKIRKEGRC